MHSRGNGWELKSCFRRMVMVRINGCLSLRNRYECELDGVFLGEQYKSQLEGEWTSHRCWRFKISFPLLGPPIVPSKYRMIRNVPPSNSKHNSKVTPVQNPSEHP
jgi:hypothetical protein